MSIKSYRPYLYAGAVIIVLAALWIQSTEIRDLSEKNERALAAVRDSLKNAQTELAAVRKSAPGLGEFMTTMQLHMGKLWFAAKASNWELAQYEFDELSETMEGAKSLHAVKNGVNISTVLDSVLRTQIAQLDESIRRQNRSDFQKAYDETRSACNGCHEESGHKFIHIVRPTAPPVTNQRWSMEPKS
jgi:cytochrome c556